MHSCCVVHLLSFVHRRGTAVQLPADTPAVPVLIAAAQQHNGNPCACPHQLNHFLFCAATVVFSALQYDKEMEKVGSATPVLNVIMVYCLSLFSIIEPCNRQAVPHMCACTVPAHGGVQCTPLNCWSTVLVQAVVQQRVLSPLQSPCTCLCLCCAVQGLWWWWRCQG